MARVNNSRNRNQTTLKDVVDKIMESYGLNEGLYQHAMHDEWKEIVGETIAKHTSDIKLKDKRLTIKIESSVLKHELIYRRDSIKNAVNDHFSREVVAEVVIR